MSETLDVMTLPLWGSRLIEASAGTGKTWTVAALYLRLVLGHGGGNAGSHGYARPLAPSEILVMTFTRAATRELSERIRARLLEAARYFRDQDMPAEPDESLMKLLAAYAPGPERLAAAWRLDTAAQCMDDAAVHTIDAWCQRMLREHAFDSGCLFDEELTANEEAMFAEAVRDFWRQEIYPLSGETLDQALTTWKDIAALSRDAAGLLRHEVPTIAEELTLGDLIVGLASDRAAKLAELKEGWAQRAREMKAWIDAQLESKACPFKKQTLAPRYYNPWFEQLAAWAADPSADQLNLKTGAKRLTPAGMREALKPGLSVELPAQFTDFERLMQALPKLVSLAAGLRLHAAAAISRRLALLKSQAGTFGFADMLTRLDEALDPERNGTHAETLRQRILTQYPVAMVDEFQDTSPVQARIFDRLYRIEANDPATALLLIGDPKQSIYAFRGADIQSYLGARRRTEGRHYVLGTNHRSTSGMVKAANHLFSAAEGRTGKGAFMFRAGEDPSADNELPFLSVKPHGRPETFVTSAGTCPSLLMELDEELQDFKTSRRRFAARCAEHIATLLNDAAAGFDQPGKAFDRLRPADIAVLVRTGKEAAAVRRELRDRRVASVYLSDKDSVFESDEARDLIYWLRAVAAPRDARLARAALATRTAGLSVAELTLLATDDEAFDARCEQLRQLHVVWQVQGVLSMLRRTLHVLDLPARWLGSTTSGDAVGSADGERRLTNFLHLAELLQAASSELEGEQALIRWLASQIEGDSATGDEKIVRLESDADLVKVVTIHKAKGLEYPIVFLPFPCQFRGVDARTARQVSLVDDETGRRTLILAPTTEQLAAADRERLREDLRLLYVALTRARHVTWVGLAALKIGNSSACVFPRSAIGYLLGGSGAAALADLHIGIESLIERCPDIAFTTVQASGELGRTWPKPRGQQAALRELTPYSAAFERQWSIGSFSAMVRSLATTGLLATSVAAVRDDEALGPATDAGAPSVPAVARESAGVAPWHGFPRGAVPGNFLHDQLEWLAGEGFALDSSPDLQQRLLRRCERQGWGHRAQDVLDWLTRAVDTPLPLLGAALAGLKSPLPEMEFWFPSEGLVSAKVDALCQAHLLGGRARPGLPERELRGMLMGFADLVFEHEGRYWVLDYKSNHLGASDASYTDDALETAMAAHRYDVQAALYLLALHRLLRIRLRTAYDPARQLGGALYFFLRGVASANRGCYLVPPSIELLEQLDALLGQPQAKIEEVAR